VIELLIAFSLGAVILLTLAMKNKRRRLGRPGASNPISLPKIYMPYKHLIWPVAIVIVGLICVYFWPMSAPGTSLVKIIGLNESSNWWNWYRWWLPLALVGLVAVRAFKRTSTSAPSGDQGSSGWILPVVVTGIIFVFAAYNLMEATPGRVTRSGAGQEVSVNLRNLGDKVINVALMDTMQVTVPRHPQSDQDMVYVQCAEITDLPWLKNAADKPRWHFARQDTLVGYTTTFAMTEALRAYLAKNGVQRVTVRWEAKAANRHSPENSFCRDTSLWMKNK